MKASGRPFLNAFKRTYAAKAKAFVVEKETLPPQIMEVTKLANGAIVASFENYSPIARIAVFFNSGPRFESPSQRGITHCLRSAVSLSTEKASAFGITRSMQQIGGSISCTTTREHMIYSMQCLRDDIHIGEENLAQVASHSAFKPWELADANARTKFDLALYQQSPEIQLTEAIHAAAFRSGLGNSLYCPSHKVGYYGGDALREFVSTHYTTNNFAIVGLGVDHDLLQIYSKDIVESTASAPAVPTSTYNGAPGQSEVPTSTSIGGQVRVDTNSPLVHAALVTEGVGIGSSDLFTSYVLQKVMGSGQFVKYGSDVASSKLAQAVTQGTESPFSAVCINATYSDTGLFGFQVVGQAADMTKILKSAVQTFGDATKGSISDADVTRAKKQLKAAFLMENECVENQLYDMGVQALLGGQVITAQEALASIDKLAKRVINGKPAMAAVGDLSSTPHLEELF